MRTAGLVVAVLAGAALAAAGSHDPGLDVADVVGGSPVRTQTHPYLVGLIINLQGSGMSMCSASLLSASRLLTAGHCVTSARAVTAVLGAQSLRRGATRVPAARWVSHPRYTLDGGRPVNDVAVVYLATDVHFSDTIQPISLPESAYIGTDPAQAVAVGYGQTGDHPLSNTNNAAYQVTLRVISNRQCSAAIMVSDENLCTAGESGGRAVGTCYGDSGGPLVADIGGKITQVGVTSYGTSLGCQAGQPSVYARVTSFLDFIRSHM